MRRSSVVSVTALVILLGACADSTSNAPEAFDQPSSSDSERVVEEGEVVLEVQDIRRLGLPDTIPQVGSVAEGEHRASPHDFLVFSSREEAVTGLTAAGETEVLRRGPPRIDRVASHGGLLFGVSVLEGGVIVLDPADAQPLAAVPFEVPHPARTTIGDVDVLESAGLITVAASESGDVVLYGLDMEHGEVVRRSTPFTSAIPSLCATSDHVALATTQGLVYVDAALHTELAHEDQILLGCDADHVYASRRGTGVLTKFDPSTRTAVNSWHLGEAGIVAMIVAPTSQNLVAIDIDGQAWHCGSGDCWPIGEMPERIALGAFTELDALLLFGYETGHIYRLDLTTQEFHRTGTVPLHPEAIFDLGRERR